MLSGIVLDTKNFTLRTGERTFEAAAFPQALRRRHGRGQEAAAKRHERHRGGAYRIMQNAQLYRGNIAVAAPEAPQGQGYNRPRRRTSC